MRERGHRNETVKQICNIWIYMLLWKRSNAEVQLEKELIIEGVLSIQAGDNPMIIKEKIRTFRAEWEEKTQADT